MFTSMWVNKLPILYAKIANQMLISYKFKFKESKISSNVRAGNKIESVCITSQIFPFLNIITIMFQERELNKE